MIRLLLPRSRRYPAIVNAQCDESDSPLERISECRLSSPRYLSSIRRYTTADDLSHGVGKGSTRTTGTPSHLRMKQIFVRGISRSGGTLMATILDAHPQVAMSYELYQHLLTPSGEHLKRAPGLAEQLGLALERASTSPTKLYSLIEDPTTRTFVARANRSGVDPGTLLRLLEQHTARGKDLATLRGRMLFIERIAQEKMRREGKIHWGTKIASGYWELASLYPNSYFLYMLRDGRDVAASRKNVGDFKQTVDDVARSWCVSAEEFVRFTSERHIRARVVSYERLTAHPEAELRAMMEFLELPWDQGMLSFYNKELTIFRHPMGHLSAKQISKPISTSSVGRWRQELTRDEIRTFQSIAGPLLTELGYEVPSDATAGA